MYVAVIKVLALPMINMLAYRLMEEKFVSDAENSLLTENVEDLIK